MLSSQDEQAERRRVFAQDQSLPKQTGTYLSHTHDDIHQGRFAAMGPAYVVGSKADIAAAYPAASSAHQTELPPEPPTGYAIDEMPELGPLATDEAQAPDPTSPLAGVGSFSSLPNPASGEATPW